MIFGAFVTLAALGSLTPPVPQAHRRAHRPGIASRPAAIDSSDLYSLRARRRFVSYLRLRLLELRESNLERAADAVERRLPISSLLTAPSPAADAVVRGIPHS